MLRMILHASKDKIAITASSAHTCVAEVGLLQLILFDFKTSLDDL